MLWNSPKSLPDGSAESRIGQPQSSEEYARWCVHFPDPQAPTTHAVVYRWEDGSNPRAPRQIVFDCVPKTEAGKPVEEVTPITAPANESRRKTLMGLSRPDLATVYGVVGLGNLPDKLSSPKAIAAILEAESKKGEPVNV